MSSAKSTVSSFTSHVTSAGSTLLKFTGIAGIAASALGGLGFGAMVHQASEAIDSNAKLSDRLGITTESLTGLQHAANLSGVANEELTSGLEKYMKTVAEAAGGNKEASAAFESLGLNASDLINLPTDQAIGKISDALNAVQNPAQRAAATMAIFGKSGQGLTPLLAEGSAGLTDMTNEATSLGLTFSRVDAAKVEAANDAITRVGEAAQGVFRKITVAIAPAIEHIANFATAIGVRLVSAVQIALPIVMSWGSAIYSTVVGWIGAAYDYIQPTLAAIGGFFRDNGSMILETYVGYFVSIYGAITDTLSGIWSLVTTIGGAIAGAWDWAMNAMGLSSQDAAGTSQSTSATIANVWKSCVDAITTAITVVGFAFGNWKSIVELAGDQVMLAIVRTGNQIEYVFTEVVPAVLTWFAANWQSILTDVYHLTTTIFSNLASNIVNIIQNIPGLISGKTSFADLWTPLTDGFHATLSELPKIAERQAGPLETALQGQVSDLQTQLGNGLADRFAANDARTSNITAAIKDQAHAIGDAMNHIPKPNTDLPKPAPYQIDTSEADAALDKTKDKATHATDSIKNITTGSAEQMQRIALAMAPPEITAAAAAVPVSPDARAAMQEGPQRAAAAQGAANSTDAIAALLGKVYTLMKDNQITLAQTAAA